MNTPAHVAASVLIWRDEQGWGPTFAVGVGAILPDLPMFGFYAYQKLWAGTTEREIWGQLYFKEDWQLLFDIFNSIPLALVVIAVCYGMGWRWGMLLAASALVHLLSDFPLHHDDAHRHFLPFTNWRFASPISYWDPKHFGRTFMLLELVFAISACCLVGSVGEHWPMRSLAFATLALYVVGIAFALAVWVNNPEMNGP